MPRKRRSPFPQTLSLSLNAVLTLTLSFIMLTQLLTATALAEGRYAKAPLSELSAVKAWALKDAERFWVKGESEVFFYDKSSYPGNEPIPSLQWKSLDGFLAFFYGALALPEGSEELLRGGRIRLIVTKTPLTFAFDTHGGVKPLKKNVELVTAKVNSPGIETTGSPFALGQWIDAGRWHKDVVSLSSWSRYSYGEGINASRIWLADRFRELPGFQVSEFPFAMPGGGNSNVIARMEGKSRPEDVYIIGAHYDSISEIPTRTAPGAEDNASGVAGLLAIARVFADYPPDATLIFVGFSGEEQGLYGSRAWTRDWLKNGNEKTIKAVLIMDMIGYSGDDEQDVLLETSALTKPLLADIQRARADAELIVSESFDYWGSDHEPFLDNGIPAILFIEDDYLDYPYYHRSTDTADHMHLTLGPKILRLMTDSLGQWVFDATTN